MLVVDDSGFFRSRLVRMLGGDPDIEIVGCAGDGQAALMAVARLEPDLVTMDVEMPVMDGIAAVRAIMRAAPTRILMLSAVTAAGADATLAALEAGAADFTPKQALVELGEDAGPRLCAHIKALCRRPVPRARPLGGAPAAEPGHAEALAGKALVVIGASTGGPAVLSTLLGALDRRFPCPLLIVQHMPETFTRCFAERADRVSALAVAEAADGEVLRPGRVLVAPGGRQTRVHNHRGALRVEIRDPMPGDLYRPCIDQTFTSAAAAAGPAMLAVVLTGMGTDGCAGSRAVRAAGGEVWAQDAASSAVFGMPAAVIRAGLANRIVSPAEIDRRFARQEAKPGWIS